MAGAALLAPGARSSARPAKALRRPARRRARSPRPAARAASASAAASGIARASAGPRSSCSTFAQRGLHPRALAGGEHDDGELTRRRRPCDSSSSARRSRGRCTAPGPPSGTAPTSRSQRGPVARVSRGELRSGLAASAVAAFRSTPHPAPDRPRSASGWRPRSASSAIPTGLKASQVRQLERLFRRQLPADRLVTHEFARAAHRADRARPAARSACWSTARGAVTHVMVGDARSIELPDWGRMRAGRGRLRGLRCIHTHLGDEPLTRDDLTDLALLRLDAMVAIETQEGGLPGLAHAAALRPANADDAAIEHLEPTPPALLDLDFHAFIRAREEELARAVADPRGRRGRARDPGVRHRRASPRRHRDAARRAQGAGALGGRRGRLDPHAAPAPRRSEAADRLRHASRSS